MDMKEEQGKEVAIQSSHFSVYKDGSVRRSEPPPPAQPGPEDPITFKDLSYNAERGLWARIYLPNPPPQLQKKLPVALFFHGGGFVIGSPGWVHPICSALASISGFLWISSSYRLAPEHRLPAAFDDGIAALEWLHSQALIQAEGGSTLMDSWLAYADFSKCFLVGESAGAGVAHHVSLHAALKKPSAWLPLCVRGIVHLYPFFMRGNGQRTEEEKAIAPEILFNWCMGDVIANLALPEGANSKEDHPFLNPIPELLACASKMVLPKTLVVVGEKDCLKFMGHEFCKALKDVGCDAEELISHGVGHCFYFAEPQSEMANQFFHKIVSFLHENC